MKVNKKQLAAWSAAIRYVLQATLTAFAVWLQQVGKKGWDQLSAYDYWFVGTALGIAALNALGAVMNGRWHESRQASSETRTQEKKP